MAALQQRNEAHAALDRAEEWAMSHRSSVVPGNIDELLAILRGETRGEVSAAIDAAEQRGRAIERADVLAYARQQSYGPTLRTFAKHVARGTHEGSSVPAEEEP